MSKVPETPPSLRASIEAAIEALINILDQLDGDENLEDDDCIEPNDDNEPSLGWTHSGQVGNPDDVAALDLEQEHDGREKDDDF